MKFGTYLLKEALKNSGFFIDIKENNVTITNGDVPIFCFICRDSNNLSDDFYYCLKQLKNKKLSSDLSNRIHMEIKYLRKDRLFLDTWDRIKQRNYSLNQLLH